MVICLLPLLLIIASVQIGQLDGVEQIFDLRLGQDVALPDNFENPFPALKPRLRVQSPCRIQ